MIKQKNEDKDHQQGCEASMENNTEVPKISKTESLISNQTSGNISKELKS